MKHVTTQHSTHSMMLYNNVDLISLSLSLSFSDSLFSIYYLDFLSILAIISGILVIVSINPVVSVLYFIGFFLIVSLYLIMLGLSFIGLVYILVYVGAIAILFLFIIMLLNIKLAELHTEDNNQLPLGMILGFLFVVPLYFLVNSLWAINEVSIEEYLLNTFKGKSAESCNDLEATYSHMNIDISSNLESLTLTSSNWSNHIYHITDINSIGNIMYSSYSIWFLLVSLILLLGIIGSIVLTLNPRLK